MARRRSHPGFGSRLQHARVSAGLTTSELALRTRISDSSLSRFESEKASPSFGDVCLIAEATGWPLLFFASGRLRTGDDPRDLVSQFARWGLKDMNSSERDLIGESRAFESLVIDLLRQQQPSARLVEAIPGLLLGQSFALEAFDINGMALRRLGWLCDIADWIATQLEPIWFQPDVRSRLAILRERAWREFEIGPSPFLFAVFLHPAPEWDAFGNQISSTGRQAMLKARDPELPPISRKWKILFRCSQERFLDRAKANLRPEFHGE